MIELGDKARIKNVETVKNDSLIDSEALKIIKKSNFQGDVTKIADGIHFIGFQNELGWVTQGFKLQEIEVVK